MLATATTLKRSPNYRAIQARAYLAKRRIRALAADPKPRAFNGRSGDDYVYMVHLDTYPDRRGLWRMSYFTGDMIPAGHANGSDYSSALELAREYGADLFNERGIE